MIAQSFVVAVREIDRRVDATLEQARLDDDRAARRVGLAQLEDLCTVDSLVDASGTLPVVETAQSPTATETVSALLSAMFEAGPLDRSALDDALAAAAARTPRVREVGGYVLVPLGDDPPTSANWRPLFRLLVDRFDRIADKLERVVARLEGDRSATAGAVRIWRSVLESCRETRTVLKIHLARQERISRLYARPGDDPVTFAKWTLDRLTDTPSQV